MDTRYRTALALCMTGLFVTAPAPAYTLTQTTLRHDAGRYSVAFDMQLAADAGRVRALMTDYDHLERLSDIVTVSRVLEVRADGGRRIQFDVRACVWVFCKTVRRVEDVATLANGDITTAALPERSDFSHAVERWHIQAQADGTRLRYEAELVPSFFVPPLLGPYLIKQAIRRELATAAERLESLAGRATPIAGEDHVR